MLDADIHMAATITLFTWGIVSPFILTAARPLANVAFRGRGYRFLADRRDSLSLNAWHVINQGLGLCGRVGHGGYGCLRNLHTALSSKGLFTVNTVIIAPWQ